MKDGLLFANSVAKSKENGLFSEERLQRMKDCQNLDDAVKILIEANYGNGTVVEHAYDFDKILDAEYQEVIKFITSVKLNIGFECFFIKNDYHNVKAILKAKYQDENPDNMLINGGIYDIPFLKEKLFTENININPYVDKAVKEIRKQNELKKSPRLIDTLIDNAMYQDINNRLQSKDIDKYVKQYFEYYIDCINISTFIRCQNINAEPSFFANNFIVGGTLDEKRFTSNYQNANGLQDVTKGSIYSNVVDVINNQGLSYFDTFRDNYLLELFKNNRSDMFSSAPVVGYYLAKMIEIKTIRILLVCIKNGVGKEEINKRMRLMYA